jgi:HK97 family phage major capsid protein
MTKHFKTPGKVRGIVGGVRADASPTDILNAMRVEFEAFKAERTKEIDDIKKGLGDVVQSEKVDRINAEITSLQKALDQTNAMMAALRTGGAGGGDLDPAKAEHAKAFNHWFRKGERGLDADLSDLEVKAALTTDSNPDGGYLVPEEMATEVDRVVGTVSAMRGLASSLTLGTDQYKKLISMGGAGSGWVGEKQARPETDTPTLRELVFNMFEIYSNPAATQKSLDDARLDLAAWLAGEVAIEFAEQEGAAFITGDGVNKPRGILGYDAVANASYAWGKIGYIASGKADDFLAPTGTASPADAFVDLYHALKQQYRNGASWLMSDLTAGRVRKFKDGDGNFMWRLPDGVAELPTFMGKPVVTDDNMPVATNNTFPVAFGNFARGYLILDRFGVRVLRDPFTNKPYVHFYTTKRVGGGIQNFEAIKLMKIATS